MIIYVPLELWRCICMEMRLKRETFKLLNRFVEKTVGTDPENFQGGCMQDIAAAKDIV